MEATNFEQDGGFEEELPRDLGDLKKIVIAEYS